jgi:hypothetical protein
MGKKRKKRYAEKRGRVSYLNEDEDEGLDGEKRRKDEFKRREKKECVKKKGREGG